MIRETSLQAYEEAKQTLSAKQQAVYDYIAINGEVCDQDIAAGLGWPINRVTPRRGELLKLGEIQDQGARPCPSSGRRVHYWTINRHFIQKELFVA